MVVSIKRKLTDSGDLSHLLLTPFPSGHTLGGSLFKLRSPTSGTVLYAVGMNHTGERHIDGMVGGKLSSDPSARPPCAYEQGLVILATTRAFCVPIC